MTKLFFVDANLPPEMAKWLRSHGQDAVAVRDLLSPRALDADVWARAVADGAVVVTKDWD